MVIHNKNSIGSVCGRAARHSLNIAKRCGQSHTPYYYSFHYKFQAAYCCASIGSLKMGKRANGKRVFRLPIAMNGMGRCNAAYFLANTSSANSK